MIVRVYVLFSDTRYSRVFGHWIKQQLHKYSESFSICLLEFLDSIIEASEQRSQMS